jgi:restriction system protein
MNLPTYDQLILPLLQWLGGQDQPCRTIDAVEFLSNIFALTEEQKSQTLNSGQRVINNRVGWASTYLKKAGLIQSPKRAFIEITTDGKKALLNQNNFSLDGVTFLMQYPKFVEFKQGRPDQNIAPVDQAASVFDQMEDQTPLERLEHQYALLKQQLQDDVLEQLKLVSPAFFETLVIDVLVAMGYGGSHQDAAKAIGRSGDGGIDGVISEDRLGLDQIYVQAKRWEGSVGRPEIHKFKGALSDQLATKGVFITTSSFTKEAIDSAKKSRIILVDGIRLAQLMIEFGVGVSTTKTYQLHRIDTDYFSNESY